MTDLDPLTVLQSHADHLQKRVEPWSSRIARVIQSKLDDAAAHAVKAVTVAATKTPDGRLTARKVAGNPSFQAALNRLDELTEALTGGSAHSLDGLIRDAREAFYRDSFATWKGVIPSQAWVSPTAQPTQIGVARIRGTPIHGMDVYLEISQAMQAAGNDLRRVVNQSVTSGIIDHQTDRIEVWRKAKLATLTRLANAELSDSNMAAHTAAAEDLVHEDHK